MGYTIFWYHSWTTRPRSIRGYNGWGLDAIRSLHTYKAHTGPEEVGFREHKQFFGRLNAHKGS